INPDMRLEQDSLGWVEVRNDALWGSQTQRALDNFNISGIAIGRFGTQISALAMIKMAAARVNCRLGKLPDAKGKAIEEVCSELIAGQHLAAFQIDAFQGGAGTSVNMNVNEVIANIANERAGYKRGSYAFIHPNDDGNGSQSPNDVYPSAVKLSLLVASKG